MSHRSQLSILGQLVVCLSDYPNKSIQNTYARIEQVFIFRFWANFLSVTPITTSKYLCTYRATLQLGGSISPITCIYTGEDSIMYVYIDLTSCVSL